MGAKYFLRVEHVDDDDYDLFSFPTLGAAMAYIKFEGLEENRVILQNFPFEEEFPLSDYTFIS